MGESVRRALDALRDDEIAAASQRFFKTVPGEYGEGDRFLGIRVPDLRAVARAHRALTLDVVVDHLRSAWHEERLVALLILVEQHRRGSAEARERIHRAYLEHARFVNNWDLVDPALRIADRFLGDPHGLIHEAVGWMEREVGERDPQRFDAFLAERYRRMPRTMLRYAIERLPEERRQRYQRGEVIDEPPRSV